MNLIEDRADTQDIVARVNHLNQVLRAIKRVNRLIFRERDVDKLIKDACDIITETGGYLYAWICLLDESGTISKTGHSGPENDFAAMKERIGKLDGLPMCGVRTMTKMGVTIVDDPSFTCAGCPLSNRIEGQGGMAAALTYGDRVYGFITVTVERTNLLDNEERELFQGVVDDIAYALHSLEQNRESNQAEEALKESRQQLADIINFLPDATFAINENGEVVAWNRAIEAMTGVRAKDMLGKGNYEYALPFYGTRRPILIDLALHADTEMEKQYSHIQKTENGLIAETDRPVVMGKWIYLWAKAAPMRDRTGGLIGAIESIRDITELKRIEEEREILFRDLEGKTKELEQIVYVSSHDLRSPLVNIQGFAREMEASLEEMRTLVSQSDNLADLKKQVSDILDRDLPESIGYILLGSEKIDTLLSGLLRISRLGRAALNIEELDMSRLLSEIIGAFEFLLKEKGVTIEVDDLPPCMGDRTQINQVFSNLLDNALKFLDPGRPGIINLSGWKEDDRVVYCVEDNGIGISSENLEKIFEIFYRLEPGATPGEGLGLTLIRKILERQRGKVWVESEQGKGSRFFVSLEVVNKKARGKGASHEG